MSYSPNVKQTVVTFSETRGTEWNTSLGLYGGRGVTWLGLQEGMGV
jgi:hypothetical protein